MLDEVQTGIGRTGTWFAYQGDETPVIPDIITLAKGLAGGIPIGAVIGICTAAEILHPGMHGSTFGGNPISARAGLAVLQAIEEDDLLTRATQAGDRLAAGVLAAAGDQVTEVRGKGLLRAAQLSDEHATAAKETEAALRAGGVLANPVTPTAIRMAPALTITDTDIDQAVETWAGLGQQP